MLLFGGRCVVKLLKSLLESFKQLAAVMEKCYEKLDYLERRLEHLVEPGHEAARHIRNIFEEYDGAMCKWALRWPMRRAAEVYGEWVAARRRQGDPWSSAAWNLVVQSAIQWLQKDCINMEWTREGRSEDAEAVSEARRLRTNLEHLSTWIPMLAGANGVENPMEDYVIVLLELWSWGRGGVIF